MFRFQTFMQCRTDSVLASKDACPAFQSHFLLISDLNLQAAPQNILFSKTIILNSIMTTVSMKFNITFCRNFSAVRRCDQWRQIEAIGICALTFQQARFDESQSQWRWLSSIASCCAGCAVDWFCLRWHVVAARCFDIFLCVAAGLELSSDS